MVRVFSFQVFVVVYCENGVPILALLKLLQEYIMCMLSTIVIDRYYTFCAEGYDFVIGLVDILLIVSYFS